MAALRLAFMGTPDFAVSILDGLRDWCGREGHELAAVYCQPPRPAGRGGKLRLSPAHAAAEAHAIPIKTPASLKDADAQAEFEALDLDVAVVAAYGLILPKAILEAPRYGCLNVHASLLPRWRGAAPIQRAIMAGDAESGVCIMQMDEGLDTGAVHSCSTLPIGPDMTAGSLHDELAALSIAPLLKALDTLPGSPTPQSDEGVTYADKIEKAEGRIDWSGDAHAVDCHIRGLSPAPGAWFESDGQRVKVLMSAQADGNAAPGTVLDTEDGITVACTSGAVTLKTLQRAGKGPMEASAFLRGFPLIPGEVLI